MRHCRHSGDVVAGLQDSDRQMHCFLLTPIPGSVGCVQCTAPANAFTTPVHWNVPQTPIPRSPFSYAHASCHECWSLSTSSMRILRIPQPHTCIKVWDTHGRTPVALSSMAVVKLPMLACTHACGHVTSRHPHMLYVCCLAGCYIWHAHLS